MQKEAPTLARILVMVGFAMSCFGLLLYLWISFGGAVPLKAEGFRFQARFDEAALLVDEADVRMAGLTVGRVKGKTLQRQGGTLVEMEIEDEFAPVPADTRAILRQKTLLGQIYVELTPGSAEAPNLPEGATLSSANVERTVEIDELVGTFDPRTRRAFQGWVQELAQTIKGNGENLNDALGNLPNFVWNGSELLETLDAQEPAVRRLIRNSGIAFAALTQRQGELRELVVNANDFFGALASRNDALAETISIFPVFLDESRLTFQRLERFAVDTRPLVQDLIPVAIKLQPTVRDVGRLAPHLERLFRDLAVLIDESGATLPHAARFLRGAEPVLVALHRFLPEFNPVLSFLNFQQQQVADFIMNGAGTLNATLPAAGGEGPRHYLRQFGIINSRGLGIQRTRQNYDRGLAYGAPNYLKRNRPLGMTESFDCRPTGGEQPISAEGLPPCYVQPRSLWDGNYFPRLRRGFAPLRPPPVDNAGTEPARP